VKLSGAFDISYHKTSSFAVVWRFVVVCLVVWFMVFVLLYYINQQTVSLSPYLHSIVGRVIHQPQTQRYLLMMGKSILTDRSISQQTLQWFVDTMYQEHCVVLTHPACALYNHQQELWYYLWYDAPKTYLILLQNSAEVRPNGGFYWSFVRIVVASWAIQSATIHDSYEVPFTNSWVILTLPERTNQYLGHNEATFIAGNKFGFTDRDGRVISAIYNKTYNTQLDGIIFISTDTITRLLPQIQPQLREWQFVNAAVDLIRWSNTGFKKDLYLTSIRSYLRSHAINLFVQWLVYGDILMQPWMVQLYLPQISPWLRDTIKQLHWITDLDSHHIYLWDINQWYNKISDFVSRTVRIQTWNQIIYETQWSIIPMSQISWGSYRLTVEYELSIPRRYYEYISRFEDKYQVHLTQRERHILGIEPLLQYQGVVFAGSGIVLQSIDWQGSGMVVFDAWLDSAAAYDIMSTWDRRTIMIDFTKK